MSTHNIPFPNMKKKIILNYPKSAAMGFVPRDPKKESETTVVNKPSVSEPLKFYCISRMNSKIFLLKYHTIYFGYIS